MHWRRQAFADWLQTFDIKPMEPWPNGQKFNLTIFISYSHISHPESPHFADLFYFTLFLARVTVWLRNFQSLALALQGNEPPDALPA